jgi:hypothetical protein
MALAGRRPASPRNKKKSQLDGMEVGRMLARRFAVLVTLVVAAGFGSSSLARGDDVRFAPITLAAQEEAAGGGDLVVTCVDDPCCGSCDGCGCGLSSQTCCLRPSWTFKAGTLILDRSTPNDDALIIDLATGNTVLDAGDFDFGFKGGWDFSLVRHNVLGSNWDLEARYFRVDGWQAAIAPVTFPGFALLQYDFHSPLFTLVIEGDSTVTAACESHLDGFELNALRPIGCEWLRFLMGFRYVELDERGLQIVQDVDGTPWVATSVSAINDLYGLQFGADARIWSCGRLTVDTLLKAGIYGNRAVTRTAVEEFGQTRGASRAEDSHPAFVGEIGVTGAYRLTDCMALRAGYQLLWLEGVAVATDQMAVSDPFAGTATVDASGSPFYHGAVVTLEMRK